MTFFAELKRRNVFRVALLYIVGGWLILQAGDVLFNLMGLPDWGLRMVLAILILGFPAALVFSWVYELTPEGLKREKDVDHSQSVTFQTGKKLDIAVIVMLAAVGGLVLFKGQIEGSGSIPAEPAEATEHPSVIEPDPLVSGIPEKSIAVLPFADMSAAGDQEYFADGISEELLNLLARVEGLKVAARTSSFKFKQRDADIAEIGATLKVRTVLEGSVRKAGNQVRITAQLINVDDGYHLWSDSFDRNLDNIFSVQDEIAGAIVEALKVQLLGSDGQSVASETTDSAEAYDLYLLGRHHFHQRTAESLPKAIDLFRQVIEIDPDFAPAWSGLSDSYVLIFQYGNFDPAEARRLALEAAARATELDPTLGEARASLGLAYLVNGRREDSLEQLRRAIEVNPGYSMAHMWLGNGLFGAGRLREAYESFENAAEVDPLHPIIAENIGDSLNQLGRHEEARAHLVRALEFNPGTAILAVRLSEVARSRGRLDEAHYWAERALEMEPNSTYALDQRVTAEMLLGRSEAAEYWLTQFENRAPESPTHRFQTASYLGESKQYEEMATFARSQLQTGFAERHWRLALGRALLLSGEASSALEQLRIVAADPPNAGPGVFSWLWGHLAFAHLALNDTAKAATAAKTGLEFIDQAVAAGYDHAWIPFNRAMMFATLGRTDDALAALESAYEMGWRDYYVPSWLPMLDQLIGGEASYLAFKDRIVDDIEQMRTLVEAEEAAGRAGA